LTETKLDDIDFIECNDITIEKKIHWSGDVANYIISLNRTLKYTKI